MKSTIQNLMLAEKKASQLFKEIELRDLLIPGKTEKEINKSVFELAYEMFGIRKYWHKRIVRCGKNTLLPYKEDPENLTLKSDDILFIDFGPIFEEWEADFGRTFVIGNDPYKLKLKNDIEKAWHEGKQFFESHERITGSQLYHHCKKLAIDHGWTFGGEIAGHIIGNYPHEKLENEDKRNYIHSLNHVEMHEKNLKGEKRNWILEIHFVDKKKEIGGFFEQLLT